MTSPSSLEQVVHIITELEEAITTLDTLSSLSDADMALMYLRHLKKALTPPTLTKETA